MINDDPQVILVDENDNEIGTMGKEEAHIQGKLHRAFSLLIFNEKNEMLIHQRADSKYHSPGLWTNACCSHPMPGEKIEDAIKRRTNEELNLIIEKKKLEKMGEILYNINTGNGMMEHEYDHIYKIKINTQKIDFNKDEIKDIQYVSKEKMDAYFAKDKAKFTQWFYLIYKYLNENNLWKGGQNQE